MEHVDILIIGAGPAGLTAAIYARRAGKSVLLLEKAAVGGQIASSPQVDNFPGLPSISGAELADRLFDQALSLDACLELEEVLEIRNTSPITVVTDYNAYTCNALIFAAGMSHRSLGLPREDSLPGISFCAVCDGAFYAGKDVAVCGGGNTALQDALYLSGLCRQVTLIHRRDTFRGDAIVLDALRQRENVTILPNTVIEELTGTESLTGLKLRNTLTGETSALPVSGLFQAVGQLPQTALIAPLLPLDDAGFLPAGEDCRTPRPGIFAAGDCRAKTLRQLTTACADGATAATAAIQYLDALSSGGASLSSL